MGPCLSIAPIFHVPLNHGGTFVKLQKRFQHITFDLCDTYQSKGHPTNRQGIKILRQVESVTEI